MALAGKTAAILLLHFSVLWFTEASRFNTQAHLGTDDAEDDVEGTTDTFTQDLLASVGIDAVPSEILEKISGFKSATLNDDPTGPLVPGMVIDVDGVYDIKEKFEFGNHFTINLKAASDSKGVLHQVTANAIKVDGKFKAQLFGHESTHFYNPTTGSELFKLRKSRHNWNPVEQIGRWSWRILPAGSKDNADALFTINRDYIGRGLLWQKEEWRIYRGRQRDDQPIMYCVGSWWGWSAECYHSESDYGGRVPVAELQQKIDIKKVAQVFNFAGLGIYLPESYYLTVKPGEDTALFLALALVVDSVHDKTSKGNLVFGR